MLIATHSLGSILGIGRTLHFNEHPCQNSQTLCSQCQSSTFRCLKWQLLFLLVCKISDCFCNKEAKHPSALSSQEKGAIKVPFGKLYLFQLIKSTMQVVRELEWIWSTGCPKQAKTYFLLNCLIGLCNFQNEKVIHPYFYSLTLPNACIFIAIKQNYNPLCLVEFHKLQEKPICIKDIAMII